MNATISARPDDAFLHDWCMDIGEHSACLLLRRLLSEDPANLATPFGADSGRSRKLPSMMRRPAGINHRVA